MAATAMRAVPAAALNPASSSSYSQSRSKNVSVPALGAARSAVFGRVAIKTIECKAIAHNGGAGAARCEQAAPQEEHARGSRVIHGRCFVVGDNIDTDQIIPAEYLTLVPSKPEEYEKLGSYAMIGLPAHWGKFIEEGKMKTDYKVIIGGDNFGCGSSREHAPVALGAAGARAVVAESYARIFFRNSVATGELYPVETQGRIWEENHTGDIVTLDMEKDILVNHTTGKSYNLKPIGEAGPVIDAGGIFAYARSTGMISSPAQ